MRNAVRFLFVLALVVGVAEGCHRKSGGGYFGPTPVPSAASHAR